MSKKHEEAHVVPNTKWTFNATSTTRTKTRMARVGENDTTLEPRVFYTTEAWHTIQYLVRTCKEEVGWLGFVEDLGNMDYLIDRIVVPKQSVTGVTTDIEADDLPEMLVNLIQEGMDPGKLYYWGHSHVNMGVGPSTQDERQVGEYIENNAVFIRGIYNKRGEAKVDVFLRDIAEVYQCVEHTPLHDIIPTELQRQLDKTLRDNVKPKAYNFGGAKHTGKSHGRVWDHQRGLWTDTMPVQTAREKAGVTPLHSVPPIYELDDTGLLLPTHSM